jgi:hypothetical protein
LERRQSCGRRKPMLRLRRLRAAGGSPTTSSSVNRQTSARRSTRCGRERVQTRQGHCRNCWERHRRGCFTG